jgi:ABC-type antimicrobial peptide transport system permease subunit
MTFQDFTHALRLMRKYPVACAVAIASLAAGIGVFDSPSFAMFILPIIIVLAVGSLATLLPSRRALSVNPASLLRTE